jgi:hypothetical protein
LLHDDEVFEVHFDDGVAVLDGGPWGFELLVLWWASLLREEDDHDLDHDFFSFI